jgi:hypothetical protein
VWCFAGDAAEGERALAPLRALRPSLDAVGVNEYRAFQGAYDLHHPFGMRADWRSATVGALTDDILDAASAPASALSYLLLRPLRDGWAYDCLARRRPRGMGRPRCRRAQLTTGRRAARGVASAPSVIGGARAGREYAR